MFSTAAIARTLSATLFPRVLLTTALMAIPCAVSSADPIGGESRAASLPDPFVVGLNLPWIKYGLDFGESGFGQFGLATDCSEGFRPERFPGSEGVTSCERSQEQVHNGSYSLKLSVDIAGADPTRPPSGEVATDLQDIADVPKDYSVNLSSEEVSAWVYVPPGNEGDSQHPNFLQIFVKDASPQAESLYGGHRNIPDAGGWLQLTMPVSASPSAFDPTQVRLLGVKVGIGGGSSATLTDAIYVDHLESTHPDVAFDFEQPSRAAIDAERLTASGVSVLRWFVFGDGRASPELDADTFVTGLDQQFQDDFDTLIALAAEYGFQIIPVLFDFTLCEDRVVDNGVPLFGRADLIIDPGRWQTFLSNALDPLLTRYGAAPEILAWEIINEPEWCIQPPLEAVTTAEMQAFVVGIAQFLRDHPSTNNPLITLGSASYSYLDLWDGLGVDWCQFHYYNCDVCVDNGQPLPATSECLLGEFTSQETQTDRSVLEYFLDVCSGNYTGALPWSWRARDDFSPIGPMQQAELLAQIEQFLDRPCGIFADGFESGDTLAWISANRHRNRL